MHVENNPLTKFDLSTAREILRKSMDDYFDAHIEFYEMYMKDKREKELNWKTQKGIMEVNKKLGGVQDFIKGYLLFAGSTIAGGLVVKALASVPWGLKLLLAESSFTAGFFGTQFFTGESYLGERLTRFERIATGVTALLNAYSMTRGLFIRVSSMGRNPANVTTEIVTTNRDLLAATLESDSGIAASVKKHVLVDSSAVVGLKRDPTLAGRLLPGEIPVMSYVTIPELAAKVSRGQLKRDSWNRPLLANTPRETCT